MVWFWVRLVFENKSIGTKFNLWSQWTSLEDEMDFRSFWWDIQIYGFLKIYFAKYKASTFCSWSNRRNTCCWKAFMSTSAWFFFFKCSCLLTFFWWFIYVSRVSFSFLFSLIEQPYLLDVSDSWNVGLGWSAVWQKQKYIYFRNIYIYIMLWQQKFLSVTHGSVTLEIF